MQRNTIERLTHIGAALQLSCAVGACGVGVTKFLDAADAATGYDTTGGVVPLICAPHLHTGTGYRNRVGLRITLHEIHLSMSPRCYHFWLGSG